MEKKFKSRPNLETQDKKPDLHTQRVTHDARGTTRNKIIIAGGGTGGHLIPNVVLAQLIRSHFPDVDITQIATSREIDHQVFKRHQVPHSVFLKAAPFSRAGWFAKGKSVFQLALNILACLKLFLKSRPDLVIGVGGYSSIAAVVAAFVLRIPVVLQEQNRVPGLANRILSRFAKHVLLGFEDSIQYFSKHATQKYIYSGNFNLSRLQTEAAHRPYPKPTLFICGGSQGAKILNDTFFELIPKLRSQHPEIHIIWQCGERWLSEIQKKMTPWPEPEKVKLLGFDENLYHYFHQSDLCVSRAGALTIADVISAATPVIFIPFPFASDNHQVANAKWLVDQEAAQMVEQKQSNWQQLLADTINTYLTNLDYLMDMKTNLMRIRAHVPKSAVFISVIQPFINGEK